MAQRGLQEITEAAALRIGTVKIAAEKADDEVLSEFVGDLGIPYDSKEIPIDRAVVTQQELFLGGQPGISRGLMGIEQDCPARFNRREPSIDIFVSKTSTVRHLCLGVEQRESKHNLPARLF